MKRLVALLPVLIALQVGVQPALAWTWPVDGPVLRPFVLGDDPYAAGQHRGIDVGAAAGSPVRAPAAGAVSFSGWVPPRRRGAARGRGGAHPRGRRGFAGPLPRATDVAPAAPAAAPGSETGGDRRL